MITIHGTNDNPISAPVHTTTPVSTLGFAPSISADGTHIAYSTSDGHVVLYDRITNTATQIDPSPAADFSGASISPDGRFVVFTEANGGHPEIFVYDSDSGHAATLLADPTTGHPINGTNPQISTDGQFIALESVSQTQVLVADRNGTIVDTFSANNSSHLSDAAISADGRLVTFVNSVSANITVQIGTSTSTFHNAQAGETYVYDRFNKTLVPLGEIAPGTSVSISAPDANGNYKIAYANASGGVSVAEFDSALDTVLPDPVTVTNAGSYRPQITLDGRYVVYTNTTTNTAYLFDLKTDQSAPLLTPSGATISASAAAIADLSVSGSTSSGIGIVAAVVAAGGTGLTVLDNTALLNSSVSSADPTVDQHGAIFAAVTEDVAAKTLTTSGTLPFSDVDIYPAPDQHSVVAPPAFGVVGAQTTILSPQSGIGQLTVSIQHDTTAAALGSDGVVSWSYSVSEQAVEALHLKPFETFNSTFAVTVYDQWGGSWTEDVTVTIIDSAPLNAAEPIFWVSPHSYDPSLPLSGDFTDARAWSSDTVPGPTDDVGLIDLASGAHYTITSAISEMVNTIAFIDTSELDVVGGTFTVINGTGIGGNAGLVLVENGATFEIGHQGATTWVNSDSHGNPGTISLQSGTLLIQGSVTLEDDPNSQPALPQPGKTGQIILSGGTIAAASNNGDTLTNVDNLISGWGTIGPLILVNATNGVIDANNSSLALTLTRTTLTNAGLLEATGGGTLHLINDLVNDFVGGQGGTIQVDGTADGSGGGTSSTLQLKASTIDDGAGSLGKLNNDGLLETTSGSSNLIENFSAAGSFTNDGKLLVTNSGTVLTLTNDVLENYNGATDTKGGAIQVDGTADGSGGGTSSTLQLKASTIDDGTGSLGKLNNDGLLETTSGSSNLIENFSAAGQQAPGDQQRHGADADQRRAGELQRRHRHQGRHDPG